MSKGLTTLFFVLGFATAFALYAGIDIYVFDHYEKMWGKGISFQVSLWLITAGAVIVALSFGIGVSVFKVALGKTVSLIVGVLFAAIVFAVAWAAKLLFDSTGPQQFTLVLFLVVGGYALPSLLAFFNWGRSEHKSIAG